MRVTVCELPHETNALADAWAALTEHTIVHASQLVLLPEFAMLDPVWESRPFDVGRWNAVEALSATQLRRLPELRAEFVVGTRPVRVKGRCVNQGYVWSAATGLRPLRSKYFLPEEPGSWEATWFHRGDPEFPVYYAGPLSFGVPQPITLQGMRTGMAMEARMAAPTPVESGEITVTAVVHVRWQFVPGQR